MGLVKKRKENFIIIKKLWLVKFGHSILLMKKLIEIKKVRDEIIYALKDYE